MKSVLVNISPVWLWSNFWIWGWWQKPFSYERVLKISASSFFCLHTALQRHVYQYMQQLNKWWICENVCRKSKAVSASVNGNNLWKANGILKTYVNHGKMVIELFILRYITFRLFIWRHYSSFINYGFMKDLLACMLSVCFSSTQKGLEEVFW
jgi:hypothetical protein